MSLFLTILVFFCQTSLSAEQYDSKVLKTKSYQEISDIINDHIKNSQVHFSEEEDGDKAILELKKGLKILLMRPDTDTIKASFIVILQSEIIKYGSFMKTLQDVIEESLGELKSQTGTISYQTSLLYLIENSLSYLQSINNKESNAILKKIRKAKFKAPKDMSNYLLLEMGRGKTASPSYLANKILKERSKELKREKKKKEKERKRKEIKRQEKQKEKKEKRKRKKEKRKEKSRENQ